MTPSLLALRLGLIVFLAWCAYALTAVLYREKQGNDQLLRHLAEGVLVLDAQGRVVLANGAFRSMFGLEDRDLVGWRHDQVAQLNDLLHWIMRDVGPLGEAGRRSVRAAGFPEYDLPDLQVTTIRCAEEDQDTADAGWVIVCRDLRDQPGSGDADETLPDRISPLANLRALVQALYGLAAQLEEEERWRAIALVEEHTTALRALLARSLRSPAAEEPPDVSLSLINVRGLLYNTRRLLEIKDSHLAASVEVSCSGSVPPVRGNRGALGRLVFRLARVMLNFAEPDDRLCLSGDTKGDVITLGFELASPLDVAPHSLSELDDRQDSVPVAVGQAVKALSTSLEECAAEWTYEPRPGRYFAVVLHLRLPRPELEPSGELEAAEALVAQACDALGDTGQDKLSAQTQNEINNALAAIRGYAELGLSWPQGERLQQALALVVELADQASETLEMIGDQASTVVDRPTVGLRVTPSREAPVLAEGDQRPAILVVDDVSHVREVIAEVLAATDYLVEVHSDADSAIAYLQSATPVLAFVDLMMPGTSGVEVLRAARRLCPDVPVVMMTGSGGAALSEALDGLQPDRVLRKPFGANRVWAMAAELLPSPATP
jgi:CheY-like chemotaxis protein